jgi:hypothetical protein
VSRLLSRRFPLIGLKLSGVFSDDDVRTTAGPLPAPVPGTGGAYLTLTLDRSDSLTEWVS